MLEYGLVITSTQKHGCPSKGTPWALCTQPRPAVWGYFTPVLLIIHTSGPPYFHMHIDMTDWSRFQCHLWALGVDLWVLKYSPNRYGTAGRKSLSRGVRRFKRLVGGILVGPPLAG